MGQQPMGQPMAMNSPYRQQAQSNMSIPPQQLFPPSNQQQQPNNGYYPNSNHPPSNQYQPQGQHNVPPISLGSHNNSSPDQPFGRGRGRVDNNNQGPAGILGGNSNRDPHQPYLQNNHGFGRGLGTLDGVGGDHHNNDHQKQQSYAASLAAQVAEKEARKKAEKMGGMRASLDRLHNSPRDALGFAMGGKGGYPPNSNMGGGKGGMMDPPNGYGNGKGMGGGGGNVIMPANYGGYHENKPHVSATSSPNIRDEKYERRQKELDYAAELRKQMEEAKERKEKEKYDAAQEDAKFQPNAIGLPTGRVRGKALGVYSSPNKPGGVYGGGGYGSAPANAMPGGALNANPGYMGPGPVPGGGGPGYGLPPGGGGPGYGVPPGGGGPGYGVPPGGGGPGYGVPPGGGGPGYGVPPGGGGPGYGVPPGGGGPGYGVPVEGSGRSRLISGVSQEDKAVADNKAIQQRRALELQMEERKAAKVFEPPFEHILCMLL
jgi:hypothetical protein